MNDFYAWFTDWAPLVVLVAGAALIAAFWIAGASQRVDEMVKPIPRAPEHDQRSRQEQTARLGPYDRYHARKGRPDFNLNNGGPIGGASPRYFQDPTTERVIQPQEFGPAPGSDGDTRDWPEDKSSPDPTH